MTLYDGFQEIFIKLEPLKEFLSANIKARRSALGISQENWRSWPMFRSR
jgi:hypothetical protein